MRVPLAQLVNFCSHAGITPLFQNHSVASLVGAPLWDIYDLAKRFSPEQFAVAFDLGHATIEGGLSWPIEVNLFRKHIRTLYLKVPVWRDGHVHWTPL